MDTSPFHDGERALQSRAGVRERLEQIGPAIIRDHLPEQHRELFGKLPTLLAAAVDGDGQPWATMLHGAPGFVSTPDARTLHIMALPANADPLATLLREGAAVGLLGLEAQTRRRNRANGRVAAVSGASFAVHVQQSFGNCPKYIQAREPRPWPRTPAEPRDGSAILDTEALDLVRRADTLFIASASAAEPAPAALGGGSGGSSAGVDISHRGGRPGFVQITQTAAGHRLTLPDYRGNAYFNTLGNLLVWPLAGLLFVDHASGDMLHIAARADVQHAGPEIAAHALAQRLAHLHVLRSRHRPAALPLAWSAAEAARELAP